MSASPSRPRRPSYLQFNKEAYPWKADVDYRAHPDLYKVGKGEQGVLIVEPYKSEISPVWRFKSPDIARVSSTEILRKFQKYLELDDFVGADMARKFLQMGYTRARRYANYKGGKKYDADNDYTPLPRGTGDLTKSESARIFYAAWKSSEANPVYALKKKDWKARYG